MFYAAFPPEINSGRIYSGPGSGPMLAAAAAWDGLANELQSTAASYSSVISVADQRALARSVVAEHGGRGHSLSDLDAGHRRAGRRNREPGHRGGKRL